VLIFAEGRIDAKLPVWSTDRVSGLKFAVMSSPSRASARPRARCWRSCV